MSENYFYSSLSGQEIEDTLLGAVRFDKGQTLSTSQMATARANIGAGSENTGFVILGYFDSLQDLQEWLQIPPKAGDAYGIGVAPPYNIYVWDDANHVWVDNGTLDIAEFIDDSETSPIMTWSSQKINAELSGKQDTLTGGDISTSLIANGAVTRAKLANDALYSPCSDNITAAYSISVSDIGYTLMVTSANVTITLTQAVLDALPKGAEIAVLSTVFSDSNLQIAVPSGKGRVNQDGEAKSFTTIKINSGYSMGVLKKTATTLISFFGNCEVVS